MKKRTGPSAAITIALDALPGHCMQRTLVSANNAMSRAPSRG